jgi:hypothetical protein
MKAYREIKKRLEDGYLSIREIARLTGTSKGHVQKIKSAL